MRADGTGPGGLPYRPCAGVVLLDARGLIWAGERRDRPGAWQMPQGGIDAGETPRQAALRELTEETSIAADRVEILAETADWVQYDLPPDMLGRIWQGRFGGQRQKWLCLRFIGTDDEVRLDTDHPEFDRWQWMTAADLLDSIVPFKRAVYAQVLDEFRDWLR
ncbi:RNA pyrophosphohydrolase [Paracoccus aestuarii]|uniref:RNA pyrophosphohydrolase n=1 Tax=Paracoccus aestuarii TaxID=453842 RepID=A0A419A337_9RHOB|nr:RNA pyrophosphohydrolase [Paracoccus aestuarii]RJL07573.1 RNA pyrophosphohydrolase [Paracoccus aestuarii]WCQ99007.1 RNA pyrophosphohydrolase [Paracoccus aestuarii]